MDHEISQLDTITSYSPTICILRAKQPAPTLSPVGHIALEGPRSRDGHAASAGSLRTLVARQESALCVPPGETRLKRYRRHVDARGRLYDHGELLAAGVWHGCSRLLRRGPLMASLLRVSPSAAGRVLCRWLRHSACAVLVLLASLSCSDPVAPECTERVERRCWSNLGLDGQWVMAVAETPWGLFAGTHDDGVFWLDPATGQWRPLGLDHAVVSSIVFVPSDPPQLLVGVIPYSDEQTPAALFSSADRGLTWQAADGGLAARNGNRAWAWSILVDASNADRLLMGGFAPILRSDDGGGTWSYVWGVQDMGGGGVRAIAQSPVAPDRVWAAGENSIFTGFVLRSEDFGRTWSWSDPNPRYEIGVWAVLPDPSTPQRVFIGVDGGVMRSLDGGASWGPSLARLPGQVHALVEDQGIVYALANENFRPPPDGTGLPDTDLGAYRTDDAGATWDTLRVPAGVRGAWAATVDRRGRLVIGTDRSGVWRVTP